jgi:hypothetical protein
MGAGGSMGAGSMGAAMGARGEEVSVVGLWEAEEEPCNNLVQVVEQGRFVIVHGRTGATGAFSDHLAVLRWDQGRGMLGGGALLHYRICGDPQVFHPATAMGTPGAVLLASGDSILIAEYREEEPGRAGGDDGWEEGTSAGSVTRWERVEGGSPGVGRAELRVRVLLDAEEFLGACERDVSDYDLRLCPAAPYHCAAVALLTCSIQSGSLFVGRVLYISSSSQILAHLRVSFRNPSLSMDEAAKQAYLLARPAMLSLHIPARPPPCLHTNMAMYKSMDSLPLLRHPDHPFAIASSQ